MVVKKLLTFTKAAKKASYALITENDGTIIFCSVRRINFHEDGELLKGWEFVAINDNDMFSDIIFDGKQNKAALRRYGKSNSWTYWDKYNIAFIEARIL